MAWDSIPRTHCFSLGDLHDFDSCVFKFFVNHHLGKKYELSEGTPNQAIGSLLDLSIKKLHTVKAYNQPVEYLENLVKAAENEMREHVERNGPTSFYGTQVQFLTPETVEKAKEIFRSYYRGINGKFKTSISNKNFWDYVINSEPPLKLWGGPDNIELDLDGIPEVVDYKYFENPEGGRDRLDMDLMPKIYILLAAKDLAKSGYQKARFKVRLWQDPQNEDYYEEFDLKNMQYIEDYFKDKIERILRTREITCCERAYCKVCNNPKKEEWIKELQAQGFID